MFYRCIIYSSKIPTMKTPPICLFQLASPVTCEFAMLPDVYIWQDTHQRDWSFSLSLVYYT